MAYGDIKYPFLRPIVTQDQSTVCKSYSNMGLRFLRPTVSRDFRFKAKSDKRPMLLMSYFRISAWQISEKKTWERYNLFSFMIRELNHEYMVIHVESIIS